MADILNELTQANILAALKKIDCEEMPERRQSTGYDLVFGDKLYPPKYVLSVAVGETGRKRLRADEFYGGKQTNDILEKLGFEIRKKGEIQAAQQRNIGGRIESRRIRKSAQNRFSASPTIVRIVVDGSPNNDESKNNIVGARKMLRDAFADWPNGKAKFALTPGGFICAPFPNDYDGRIGWDSRPQDFASLIPTAQKAIDKVLIDKIKHIAVKKAMFLTLGVDLCDDDEGAHAELVAMIKTDSGKTIRWTGKSYPTLDQQNDLVNESNLDSHFLRVAGERVLILGCHDLNMFNPRGYANQKPGGLRRRRCDEMRKLAKKFDPTTILQHPHSTDTPNIWKTAWHGVHRLLPTARICASGIAYYNHDEKCRGELKTVRAKTQFGNDIIDVVVDGYPW